MTLMMIIMPGGQARHGGRGSGPGFKSSHESRARPGRIRIPAALGPPAEPP